MTTIDSYTSHFHTTDFKLWDMERELKEEREKASKFEGLYLATKDDLAATETRAMSLDEINQELKKRLRNKMDIINTMAKEINNWSNCADTLRNQVLKHHKKYREIELSHRTLPR